METKVRHLVVALVFDPTLERVLLVRKITKGAMRWMNGRLNGPGGKVEQTDLNLRDAATRELREETGVHLTGRGELRHLRTEEFIQAHVHFFYGVTHQQPRQLEAEPVFWLSVEEALNDPALIDNLREFIRDAIAQIKADRKLDSKKVRK